MSQAAQFGGWGWGKVPAPHFRLQAGLAVRRVGLGQEAGPRPRPLQSPFT